MTAPPEFKVKLPVIFDTPVAVPVLSPRLAAPTALMVAFFADSTTRRWRLLFCSRVMSFVPAIRRKMPGTVSTPF